MIFIRYDIIARKPTSIFDHFEDVANLLTMKFREQERSYALIFYDVAFVSPELSKQVNMRDYDSLGRVFLWHLVPGERQRGVTTTYEIGIRAACRFIKESRGKVGALHLDVITPYAFETIGTLITDYRDRLVGIFELDIFDSFDVVPHIGKKVDEELINMLRRKYSCGDCRRSNCANCNRSMVVTHKY